MISQRAKRAISRVMIIICGVILAVLTFRAVQAGTISPAAAPASSYRTLSEVNEALIGTSFDASSIASDSDGSALQMAKCIITQMHGRSC